MHRPELAVTVGGLRASNELQDSEQHASFSHVISLLYFSIFHKQLSCFDLPYEVTFRSIYIKPPRETVQCIWTIS